MLFTQRLRIGAGRFDYSSIHFGADECENGSRRGRE
jgi:hypothetical protein